MLCFKTLASIVEGTRLRIDEANQLIAIESAASASISDAFDGYRKARDWVFRSNVTGDSGRT